MNPIPSRRTASGARDRPKASGASCLMLLMTVCPLAAATLPTNGPTVSFELRRRDPVTGQVKAAREMLNPRSTGVVIIDMWNFHWCKTSSERVAALVPRMSKAVDLARDLGMTVFWCPSDVADNYAGTIPHEQAMAARKHPLPPLKTITCPPAADGGGCTCGPERCRFNYGWDAMHPDLRMRDTDFLPNDFETLYSLCRERGITHLIYMGVHTQVCLLGKSVGLLNLSKAGLRCILARDLTDAHGKYDPVAGITPDRFTADVVEHFEKHLAPSINFVDELTALGKWHPDWIVDPVRVAPWGTWSRPHLFEKEITITLSAPWQPNAVIYLTWDGSEPGPHSERYKAPLPIRNTAQLRAAAFENGRKVSLTSDAYFARLPPPPPMIQVPLSELKPARAVGPGHSPSASDHRFSAGSQPPQTNRNN